MKKMILTVAIAATTIGAFAQNASTTTTTTTSSSTAAEGSTIMSKKGEVFLPEAGDWAISFSATPFLNYFGQLLSNAGSTAPTANFLNTNQTIIGKYYVDNQTAYRGLLRIGINSMGQDNLVAQDGGSAGATVTDHASYAQHFIGLGAGMEKRKGKTRLQGYYGAEFMFFLAGSSNTYTYGNSYTSTYQAPVSTTWANPNGITPTGSAPAGSRTLSMANGSTFGISLQGFIGFEYFFMPKISVGGEYTWGINFQSTGQGSMAVEAANGTTSTTTTTNTGGSSQFSLDSGINTVWGASQGNLYINFHF